jgi:hypothetical protein
LLQPCNIPFCSSRIRAAQGTMIRLRLCAGIESKRPSLQFQEPKLSDEAGQVRSHPKLKLQV